MLASCVLLVAMGASEAVGQVKDRRELETPVRGAWEKILEEAGAVDRVPKMKTEKERVDFYTKLLDQLLQTPEAREYQKLYPTDRERYLAGAMAMAADEAALARSANAASTNPRSVGLIERSGIVDLISTALQGTNLVSANDTAVTVNLSAAALLCSACRDLALPAATRYRAGHGLNRLSGSLTFGAKIPEKEITGFSGLPDTDKLFDVVVWDAKFRVLGDRDPRARDWDDALLGELGGLSNLSTLTSDAVTRAFLDADPTDVDRPKTLTAPFQSAFDSVVRQRTGEVANRIRRSLQVSVKFSGQHLTTQPGMNRYTGVLLADKGLGAFDGSLNVSYSAVQDVKIKEGTTVTLKQWKSTAGFVGSIWKGVFVANRSAELALTGEAVFPVDGDDMPVVRKKTYKGDLALKIPISDSLDLPFSVTYTNDPNELAKKSYVTGRLGITYDFGSLKRLAQGK